MYSRYYPNRKDGVRLPENYSGCAFPKERSEEESAPVRSTREPPLTKKPPEDAPTLPPLPLPPAPLPPAPLPPPPEDPPSTPADGLLSRLTHLLDFDQLLILGLILLLLQSDADAQTVLWLLLLLFC